MSPQSCLDRRCQRCRPDRVFSGSIGAVDAEFCPGLPPPHVETQVLVFNGLHFATDLHNGSDHFAKFQLVDNRGLSCALRSTIRIPLQSCQPSAPKSGWKPNQWQPIRSDGSEIAPRLTSPLLLPLPPLLPLPHCCYCSVTAVCRFSSAVFLGAPPLLNCYCADTSVTMHATNDLSSSLPLLSFVTSFAVSTHLHDSSDSSYQRFNLMPCFPLRQVVCQIMFARDSSHFYSS